MNRLNPIHIGTLLVVILGFMFFNLSGATKEYFEAKDSYKETLLVANELSGLKEVYANKKQTKISLQKILNHSILKSAKIEQKSKKTAITIHSKSMDMSALNFLMGKLLNGTYRINTLKIKQLSKTKVSLQLEIKW